MFLKTKSSYFWGASKQPQIEYHGQWPLVTLAGGTEVVLREQRSFDEFIDHKSWTPHPPHRKWVPLPMKEKPTIFISHMAHWVGLRAPKALFMLEFQTNQSSSEKKTVSIYSSHLFAHSMFTPQMLIIIIRFHPKETLMKEQCLWFFKASVHF